MGSKRNAWKKLAMAVAVPGVAVGTLAGFAAAPAMAGTNYPHPAQFETIRGYGQGPGGIVNVQAAGAFYDYGWLNLNSGSNSTEVHLSQGSLYTVEDQGSNRTRIQPFSCSVTSQTTVDYWILGGSGRYRHVSGQGTATITTSGVLPRKHHGQCDTNANPLPGSEHTTFVAQGPVEFR